MSIGGPLLAALVYAGVAWLWLVPAAGSGLVPGTLFVAVTAAALFGLLWRRPMPQQREAAALTRALAAEAAARESAEQYRSMVSTLDEGILVFDAQGRVKGCSPRAERLLGRTLAELQGRPWPWRLLRADGTPMTFPELPVGRVMTTGQGCRDVLVGVDVPGGRRWLSVNAEPVRDPASGQLVDIVTTFGDITERHVAQQQLLKLSMAVEQCPLGIVITDFEGRIEYVNGGFTRVTGFTREESIGKRRRVLQPGRGPADAVREMRRTVAGGNAWRGELHNARKDGTIYDEFLHAAPVRQADGTITHFLAISEDISEHKRISAELVTHRAHLEELVSERTGQLEALHRTVVESERFIRTLADNQPGMLSYWDHELRCRFANRAYREWYGRSEQEIIGMPASELIGVERMGTNVGVLPALRRGEAQHQQRRIVSDDGREMHGLISFIPDVVDGEMRGFLVLVADITEVKRAEMQLQQANAELMLSRDKAEQANRAKSAFLANMSHEIRTPMNAIIGLTHLLQRDIGDAVARERIAKVGDAAGHLLEIINDILDLSKIEAGGLELERAAFSLSALLARVRDLIAERAQAKGLTLQIDAAGVPDRLRGDATRLSQALINLLSNAVKFTARGGIVVTVRLRERIESRVRLRFAVRDSGIGIPAEQLRRLFQAFVQADPSTTRRFGGTGLGLVITQRLALMMDGNVGATSESGVGSEFWFEACVEEAFAEGAPPPAPADACDELRRRHAGAAVLVAEDNFINQEVARELLRTAELEVDVANDGIEAVAMVERKRYDLVLMDMQMPGIDGLEATRRIRKMAQAAQMPILAMTANAFDADRADCVAAGMDDHVGKPVNPEALYLSLLHWLGHARAEAGAAPDAVRHAGAVRAAGNGGNGGSPAGTAPRQEQLARLQALLEAADYDAVGAHRALASELRSYAPEVAREVEAAVRAFDFEVALAALRTLPADPAAPV